MLEKPTGTYGKTIEQIENIINDESNPVELMTLHKSLVRLSEKLSTRIAEIAGALSAYLPKDAPEPAQPVSYNDVNLPDPFDATVEDTDND